MAGMTFVDIVNATLAGAFAETYRTQAKRWVNARQAKLVDLAAWNFRYATDLVTATAGSSALTGIASDVAIVLSLQRDDGVVLTPIEDVREFQRRYYDAAFTPVGTPEAFTVIGGGVQVGPQPVVTSALYELTYQRAATEMVADTDVPIIPWQYHNTLVMGAKAEGMRTLGIPLWGEFEEAWANDIAAMERSYLTTVRQAGEPFSGQFVPGRA